ncbi:MAG: DHH family phosphoesterase [Nanoarchaeota archaeon]
MKFTTKKNLEKLASFLEIDGSKILFYHNDADGITSAALFLKFFHDFDPRQRKGPMIDDDFIKELEIECPDLVVFLDLQVDRDWEKLQSLLKKLPNLKIVIIDHHIFDKNMNSEKIVHINPIFDSDVYIPASAVVYQLLKDMEKNVKPYIWISCMGIIGDYGFDDKFCKSIFNECKKMYPELIEESPQNSKLAEGVKMVSAATSVRGFVGVEKALESLLQARYYKDFSSIKIFEKWTTLAKTDFDKAIKRAEVKKTVIDKVVFFPVKAKYGIHSDIGTRLGEKYKDSVIVTIRDLDNGWYKIGMRAQSGKFNLANIIKKCVKGIGSGGGHVKAAGLIVNDLEKFKKRLLKEVNKK